MAKPGARSTSTPNVAGNAGSGAQAVSTHPNTRTIGAQVGAVKPATVPIPSIADCESRRQKPKNDDAPCSITNLPTNESMASSLQHPVAPDVAVPTKH
jgi:Tfp pilus assembly protein FimV